jgi:hypothetical protein
VSEPEQAHVAGMDPKADPSLNAISQKSGGGPYSRRSKHDVLTAPATTKAAAASPVAAAASAGLPRLKAVLAIHGTIPTGLEWNRGLLSASGADHACTLRCTAAVPAAAATLLLVLLGLTARFAALRRRITTLAEEFLVLSGKRECLPAIAAHELLIFSHISPSSMLLVCSAFKKPSNVAVLPRPLAFAADSSKAKSVELIDRFRAIAKSNEFRLELPDRDELCLRRRQGEQRISVSFELSGGHNTQGAATALPSSVGILK